jgi:surface protein
VLTIILALRTSKQSESKRVIGEINCLYNIYSISSETQILGDEYNKLSDLDIYINEEKIKYNKFHKFSSTGINKVSFKLYENIIMDNMFQNVDTLQSLEMNTEKNAKILSMKSTFENCKNIESVNISNFDTSSLKSLRKLFFGVTSPLITFNNFDTNYVEDMSFLFANTKYERIDMSLFNTKNVKDISYMFYGCSSLLEFDFSNFDTSNVKNMSYLFYNCNLNNKDLSTLDTTYVEDMSHMFEKAAFVTLNLDSFNTKNVIDMSYMFENCNELQSLDLA